MKRLKRTSIWIVVAAPVLLAIGCGSQNPSIRGTVTFDGQPVEKGSISFIPNSNSGTKAVGLIQDGSYNIVTDSRLSPGQYRVEIRWSRPTGRMKPDVTDPPNVTEELRQVIPPKYNTASTLAREITRGSNTLDFQLARN